MPPPITTASTSSIASFSARASRCEHGALRLNAQAVDPQAQRLSGAQVRRRLLAEPDARRRPGRDHVAGVQAHEARQVADELRDAEDHRARVAVLVALAVDLEPDAQLLRVGHLVARHEVGPDRPERVAALALDPLTAALELEMALREIVDDAVAGDVLQRALGLDVLGARADDDAELDLPVDLLGAPRDLD